jgi:hypothetical protein
MLKINHFTVILKIYREQYNPNTRINIYKSTPTISLYHYFNEYM